MHTKRGGRSKGGKGQSGGMHKAIRAMIRKDNKRRDAQGHPFDRYMGRGGRR